MPDTSALDQTFAALANPTRRQYTFLQLVNKFDRGDVNEVTPCVIKPNRGHSDPFDLVHSLGKLLRCKSLTQYFFEAFSIQYN